ncbi:GntR family transcriptional regulator [Frigidibacter sp. ROC022]|uniref:GntR family transcriptional regulator n=1 Tax=Frigidibacter sp. ROC022 TaxID=2971796 RepID=UPI00215A53C4|nr:GntR family transcriptional regulator [Frigidibacter sp. ROC022]MCR8722872.1 GntR family transcriptional regulator [Frigidibacter sp. ROC022]
MAIHAVIAYHVTMVYRTVPPLGAVQLSSNKLQAGPAGARGLGCGDAGSRATLYETIRNEILSGGLAANARLKVSELARRYNTSTNPVREALQQLRGEGFVVIEPNRGARVRQVNEDYARGILEMQMLIEPYLVKWFCGVVTRPEIERLTATAEAIEELDFADLERHSQLDLEFHQIIYARHYNSQALTLWRRQRDILGALNRGHEVSLSRRKAVLHEHRALIAAISDHDGARAAELMTRHVLGSMEQTMTNIRSKREPG